MGLKILLWLARVLAILVILIMFMFSFDVFGGDESTGRKLLGFIIHNIPAIALIISLIIAWKNEILGGVIFILLSVILSLLFKTFSGNSASLIILIPILLTGVMFVLHHFAGGKTDR